MARSFRLVIELTLAAGAVEIAIARSAAAERVGDQAFVEEHRMSVVDQMVGIDQAKRASVSLMPKEFFFRTALTEQRLWSFGCPYTTADPARISALIDILRHADLNVVEPNEAGWMNEPREGVSLELQNGTHIRFSFTIKFNNLGVRGYFYKSPGVGHPSYLTVKSTLPEELVAWAVRIGPSIPTSRPPEDIEMIQQACDYFEKMGG
jgi:hypothetical protein